MILGMIMDPIESIHPEKSTDLALLLEAQRRGFELHIMQQTDLFLSQNQVMAHTQIVSVTDDPNAWFTIESEKLLDLSVCDMIFMRKDPPFDMNYIYTTYFLEHIEKLGVHVINKPQSLRDANEKLFATQFSQCCPPLLVSSQLEDLQMFLDNEGCMIIKPLDGMGGTGIHKIDTLDATAKAIIRELTRDHSTPIMAQRYLPEIKEGDKRIIMINGEVIPFCLARIPQPGSIKANLAAGGHGEVRELTDRDHWIAEQVGPTLKEKGLLFVGLDVIGDYLTEINVTSPTCIREIEQATNLNICAKLFDTKKT